MAYERDIASMLWVKEGLQHVHGLHGQEASIFVILNMEHTDMTVVAFVTRGYPVALTVPVYRFATFSNASYKITRRPSHPPSDPLILPYSTADTCAKSIQPQQPNIDLTSLLVTTTPSSNINTHCDVKKFVRLQAVVSAASSAYHV